MGWKKMESISFLCREIQLSNFFKFSNRCQISKLLVLLASFRLKTKQYLFSESVIDPQSKTIYSRRGPVNRSPPPQQRCFLSLWTEKTDSHSRSSAELNWLLLEYKLGSQKEPACVFVHLSSLMSANHFCSLFTTYALSNTQNRHACTSNLFPSREKEKLKNGTSFRQRQTL